MTLLPITVTERPVRLGPAARVAIGAEFSDDNCAVVTPTRAGWNRSYRNPGACVCTGWIVRTRGAGRRASRYHRFPTYPMALAYALEWANRKSRELARTNQGA